MIRSGIAEKRAVPPQGHIMHFIVEGFVDLCSVVLTIDHYSGSGTGTVVIIICHTRPHLVPVPILLLL